jgi:hypothetical protein
MSMPDPNIPKILTLTTAPIFSTFSADWFTKVCASEAPLKDKSQFN